MEEFDNNMNAPLTTERDFSNNSFLFNLLAKIGFKLRN